MGGSLRSKWMAIKYEQFPGHTGLEQILGNYIDHDRNGKRLSNTREISVSQNPRLVCIHLLCFQLFLFVLFNYMHWRHVAFCFEMSIIQFIQYFIDFSRTTYEREISNFNSLRLQHRRELHEFQQPTTTKVFVFSFFQFLLFYCFSLLKNENIRLRR